MTDFDYRQYSLKQLKEWVDNAVLSSEASPQEIYDVIKGAVDENYHYFKHHTGRCYELLSLLNGNGKGHIEAYDAVMREREYYEPSMPPWGHSDLEYMVHNKESLSCDKDDSSAECKSAWNSFWNQEEYGLQYTDEEITAMCDAAEKKDKVVKWQLPVEIDASGEYFVSFPDDLLEAAGLKEGEKVEWIDKGDGSFELRKVNVK
jgi:hypothetical protein